MKSDLDEKKRLDELYSYQILDTNSDFNLNEITQLAAYICEVPIALISLVDKDRQWFKAKVGLQANQTARDISFCTHAIEQNDLFVVEDSHIDDRFKNNPLVLGEPFVRFYAGQPLKTPSGNNIGTLCVIDHKVKKLSEKQKELLQILSRQVINYFELYKTKKELEILNIDIISKERQSSILNLSSGIAHEINNPLAIIIGKINSISNKIELYERKEIDSIYLQKDFDIISTATSRIVRVVKSLRDFSNCKEDEPYTLSNIKDIFKSIFFMFENKFKKENVTVEINLPDDLQLNCKLVNLSQAFYNLILNSFESVMKTNNRWIKIDYFLENDNFLLIKISDSGESIDKNIIHKLMEPFISTKEKWNEPKGLGLCIAKRIIEAHRGDLFFCNESIHTTFNVRLNLK